MGGLCQCRAVVIGAGVATDCNAVLHTAAGCRVMLALPVSTWWESVADMEATLERVQRGEACSDSDP